VSAAQALPLPRGSRGIVLGGIRLRRRVKRRALELDRRLAAGADPIESDELSLRVGQLGSANARMRLARALRAGVRVACNEPNPALRSRAWEIRANRDVLWELAERIGGDAPIGIQGLAKAWLLVYDPPSRLYRPDPARPLGSAAIEALDELEHGQRTAGLAAV
jgi:hypothetical protein